MAYFYSGKKKIILWVGICDMLSDTTKDKLLFAISPLLAILFVLVVFKFSTAPKTTYDIEIALIAVLLFLPLGMQYCALWYALGCNKKGLTAVIKKVYKTTHIPFFLWLIVSVCHLNEDLHIIYGWGEWLLPIVGIVIAIYAARKMYRVLTTWKSIKTEKDIKDNAKSKNNTKSDYVLLTGLKSLFEKHHFLSMWLLFSLFLFVIYMFSFTLFFHNQNMMDKIWLPLSIKLHQVIMAQIKIKKRPKISPKIKT